MFDPEPQLDVFPRDIVMHRVDPAARMHRFYRMTVQANLFGGATLIREWGRTGRRGQVLSASFPDEGQAINALLKLVKLKQRRGYRL